MSTSPLSITEFAKSVRDKYPKVYDHLSDAELVQRVVNKYPQYKEHIASYAPTDFETKRSEGMKQYKDVGTKEGAELFPTGGAWEAAKRTLRGQIPSLKTTVTTLVPPLGAALSATQASGIASEAKAGYKRGGTGEAALSGLGAAAGVSASRQRELAEQARGGDIVGEAAVPAAEAPMAVLGPEAMRRAYRYAAPEVPGEPTPKPETTTVRKPGSISALDITKAILNPSSIPKKLLHYVVNELTTEEGKPKLTPPPEPLEQGKYPSVKEFEDIQKQHAAHAKRVGELESARMKQITEQAKLREIEAKDQQIKAARDQRRLKEIETERQRQITEQAKLANLEGKEKAAADAAHEKRMKILWDERQKILAANEKLKEQEAQARMRRGREQTSTTPPPPPAPPGARGTEPAPATPPPQWFEISPEDMRQGSAGDLASASEEALWKEYMKNRGTPYAQKIAEELKRRLKVSSGLPSIR